MTLPNADAPAQTGGGSDVNAGFLRSLGAVAVVCAIVWPGGATAQELQAPTNLKVTLNIEVQGRDVIARLAFRNTATDIDDIVCLYRHMTGIDGRFFTPIFEISSEGEDIPYTDLMIRKEAAFIVLDAGRTLNSELVISNVYGFKMGRHRYKIHFNFPHSSFPCRDEGYIDLMSNEVEFEYEKKPWWKFW